MQFYCHGPGHLCQPVSETQRDPWLSPHGPKLDMQKCSHDQWIIWASQASSLETFFKASGTRTPTLRSHTGLSTALPGAGLICALLHSSPFAFLAQLYSADPGAQTLSALQPCKGMDEDLGTCLMEEGAGELGGGEEKQARR